MAKKRVLLLDEKTETSILMVCDVALKFAGMHMATVVADVALAIADRNDQPIEEEDV